MRRKTLKAAVLHIWKRQMLLSIAGGTICYMLLLHFMIKRSKGIIDACLHAIRCIPFDPHIILFFNSNHFSTYFPRWSIHG
uniref:hypothetical protein n=1 Tax=Agathobacter sp. TaxID=2021311 RepID=UPI003FF01868